MKKVSTLSFFATFLKKGLLLMFLLTISTNLYALSISIEGPNEVCPGGTYTFTSTAKDSWGNEVTASCGYVWWVIRDGVAIAISTSDPNGNGYSDGPSFTYTFDNISGPVVVKVYAENGLACSSAEDTHGVNIQLKAPAPISGPLSMCAGDTKIFRVTDPTSDPNTNFGMCNFHHYFDWAVPSGWTVTTGNPTRISEVSIKAPLGTPAGTYQVKVRGWYDDSGNYTPYRTYNVTIGPPDVSDVIIYGPSEVCAGDYASYYVNPIPGATSYKWDWPNDWTYYGGQGSTYIDLSAPNKDYFEGAIYLKAVNSCGESVGIIKFVKSSTNCAIIYSVAPNPSRGSFAVLAEDPKDKDKEEIEEFDLFLYNDKQKLVKSLKSSKKTTKIDTKELPDGKYALHIISKDKTIIKLVIIKK